MATVTIRLVELELSAGTYDGSRVELSSGSGYVEVNQTYTEVTIAEAIHLEATDPITAFVQRLLFYIYGDSTPTAYVRGKDRR